MIYPPSIMSNSFSSFLGKAPRVAKCNKIPASDASWGSIMNASFPELPYPAILRNAVEGGSNPRALDVPASSITVTLCDEPEEATTQSSRSARVHRNPSPHHASDPPRTPSYSKGDGSCDARRPTITGSGGQCAPIAEDVSVLRKDEGDKDNKAVAGRSQDAFEEKQQAVQVETGGGESSFLTTPSPVVSHAIIANCYYRIGVLTYSAYRR